MAGSPGGDSALARQLWLAAAEQEAELRLDSALALLHAARAADPSFLPAQFDYFHIMLLSQSTEALRREFSIPDPRGGLLTACLAQVTRHRRDRAVPWHALRAMTRGCPPIVTVGFMTRWIALLPPAESDVQDVIADDSAALKEAPELWRLWFDYTWTLPTVGREADARAAAREGAVRARGALGRALLYERLFKLQMDSGDTAGAMALGAVLRAAIERDGRPGLRAALLGSRHYAEASPGQVILGLSREEAQQERLRLARMRNDWYDEWGALMVLGGHRGDREPTAAAAFYTQAIAVAERNGTPFMQRVAYASRGRAYSKMGRLAEAERDLKRAIVVGAASEERYYLAEAYHNLAHTYESAGRWVDAVRAADKFVALKRPYRHDDMRMMSLRDAGTIRWKAGWHAAADANFREMVHVIDELKGQYYWAGEYFERIGDFPRALRYYRLGVTSSGDADNVPLSLGGLARVYERLGWADSAEAAARAHDRKIGEWLFFEGPLLPRVLARQGRRAEAVRAARAWAEQQGVQASVHGAVTARLQLAELLLEAEDFAGAQQEAGAAERMAIELRLTDEVIRTRRLRGLAALRAGQTETGLQALSEAAGLARAYPTVEGVLVTHTSLGDALAATGRPRAALAAYERAARAIERVTAGLDVDLDRAGYRERHLTPFDGAVRVLLDSPPTRGAMESLIIWSQRRKGAVLALATLTRSPAHGRSPPPLPLDQIGRRLRRDEVLLDYMVTDEGLAAVVVTRAGARLLKSPVPADSVRRLVERFRRPLLTIYAGRLDLARAPFDLRAARTLHEVLLEPLDPYLRGVRRVIVVPDGVLHYVPFEALVGHASDSRPAAHSSPYVQVGYAIDRYEIVYLPSVQFLVNSVKNPAGTVRRTSGRVLAVARDAPGSALEVERIRAAWQPGEVTVLEGEAATESAVRSSWDRYRIVHFATHAEVNDADPLASHLRLGADDENDGYLHLGEIASKGQRFDLAVLSACETVSGRLYRGEGLMGLARAFLASGTEAVVATQWPVGPSAELMRIFYERLALGEEPSVALRAAKLALRHDPKRAHPFYWAGFVLVAAR